MVPGLISIFRDGMNPFKGYFKDIKVTDYINWFRKRNSNLFLCACTNIEYPGKNVSPQKERSLIYLHNAWEPAGGYTTLNKLVFALTNPPQCPDNIDVDITIDNNQKGGKTSGRI